MLRDMLEDLQNWRTDPAFMPLVIRGARQVGKSWLVRDFPREFTDFIELISEGRRCKKMLS